MEKIKFHNFVNRRLKWNPNPELTCFNDYRRGIRFNKASVDYFGEGSYVSIGIDFRNKLLLLSRSSRGDPDAYKMRNRIFRNDGSIVNEIFERFDVPYGVCRTEGKQYGDGEALVFDLGFFIRELKGRKDGFVDGHD